MGFQSQNKHFSYFHKDIKDGKIQSLIMEDTPGEQTSNETISALRQMSIALYEDNTEYFKTVLSSLSPELVRI